MSREMPRSNNHNTSKRRAPTPNPPPSHRLTDWEDHDRTRASVPTPANAAMANASGPSDSYHRTLVDSGSRLMPETASGKIDQQCGDHEYRTEREHFRATPANCDGQRGQNQGDDSYVGQRLGCTSCG